MYKGLDISGKVVLVTGGTSGIGRAIALAMAQAGAKIVAGSSSEAKVAAIKKELGGAHDAVHLAAADEKTGGQAVATRGNRLERMDAMVSAARLSARQPPLDVSSDE